MQINKTLWKLVYEPLIGKWATTPSTNECPLYDIFIGLPDMTQRKPWLGVSLHLSFKKNIHPFKGIDILLTDQCKNWVLCN